MLGYRRRRRSLVFSYQPDLASAAISCSRASTATYVDVNGVVQTAAINALRDGHYIGGVRTTLIEGSRTNSLTRSQDFGSANWSKDAGLVATSNSATGPDGTATASLLTESAVVAAQRTFQSVTTTPGQPVPFSITLKQNTQRYARVAMNGGGAGPGVIVDLQTGLITQSFAGAVGWTLNRSAVTALGSGWYKVEIVGTNTTALAYFCIAGPHDNTAAATSDSTYTGTGKSILAWGAQAEVGATFASSYIPTAAAAVTRSVDLPFVPFPYAPQSMTGYIRGINLGTAQDSAAPTALLIGGGANPRFIISGVAAGNQLRGIILNSAGASAATIPAQAVAIGDLVEARLAMAPDGTSVCGVSVAAGAEVLAAGAAVPIIDPSWSLPSNLYIGVTGGGAGGFFAFQSVKVILGVRSLSEMRAA